MTGYGVSGSISVELAPSRPQTFRANSETATCIPRQMPRYGIPRSRATRQAVIFPSQPREPKPPGHEDAVDALELGRGLLEAHPLGVDPADADPMPWWMPACLSASCTERYASWSFTYLPTSAISTSPLAFADPVGSSSHSPSRARRRAARALADEAVEALLAERLRDEVDVADVLVRDHRSGSTSAKSAIFSRMSRESGSLRAADDDVWVDTDAPQLVDRVLRRLRLQLARRLDERDEGDVEVEDVLGADLAAELADRLEERERLDVADRAADLGDDDVGVASPRRRGGCGP